MKDKIREKGRRISTRKKRKREGIAKVRKKIAEEIERRNEKRKEERKMENVLRREK